MQGDPEKDGDLRVRETDLTRQNQTINKATATSSSWPNESPYNVYKACPSLTLILWKHLGRVDNEVSR